MDGSTIFKRHHPEGATTQLRQYSPEADTIILLRLNTDRISDDPDTHLPRQIRAFSEHFVLEVPCTAKVVHEPCASATFALCSSKDSQSSSPQRRSH